MRQKSGKRDSFHLRTAPKLLLVLTLGGWFHPEKRVGSQLSPPGRARELLLGLALSYSLLQTDKHQPRLVIAFKLQPAAMGKRLEDHKYWLTKHWNGSKLPRRGTCWVRAPWDLVLTRNEFYPDFSSSSQPWVLEKTEWVGNLANSQACPKVPGESATFAHFAQDLWTQQLNGQEF